MKNTKVYIFSIVTLLIVLTGTTRMAAAADNYLGEICWKVPVEGGPVEEGSIYKMGIFNKGAGHYSLLGTYDGNHAVHGNLEIVGENTITVTLFGSADYNRQVVSQTLNATLSVSTLSGPAHQFGISVDLDTNEIQNFYSPHRMINIACPNN
jgi:hypothetical protein